MSLTLFDCNAVIGKRVGSSPLEPATVEELKRDMAYFGIAKALVAHASSWCSEPQKGHENLFRDIGGNDSFVGCGLVVPDDLEDVPPIEVTAAQLLKSGARAVRLMPARMGWRIADWCAARLLNVLEELRIPALIPHDQVEFNDLDAMLSAHPDLPVVLVDFHCTANRMIVPLLKWHANLRLCIGPRFPVHDVLEVICETIGAGQLVFGTRWPESSPGATVGLLMYARISDADRQAIASGNLERLLSEVKT